MKNNLVESLETFFKTHSKEEIKAIWDSSNYSDDDGGYKVVDWLKQQERNDLLTKIRDKKK